MGLDMYLTKHIYIGAKFEHNKIEGRIEIKRDGKPIKINMSKVDYVIEGVGYWRKANQIHNWFVENVQSGVDECVEHDVDFKQLQELKKLCKKALRNKDCSLLPPQSGFFFGSTDIDEYYWKDLKYTIEIIDALEDPKTDSFNFYYKYRSSW
jgi:hypothetical protein